MDSAPHIAIVDDHRDIRDLVGKYLMQHGYRISLAEKLLHCAVCWNEVLWTWWFLTS